MSWLGVFVVCASMDFAWARYIKHAASGSAMRTSVWAVAVFLLGAMGVIAYTENHWLLIPATSGCFVGTYMATSKPLSKLVAAVSRGMSANGQKSTRRFP